VTAVALQPSGIRLGLEVSALVRGRPRSAAQHRDAYQGGTRRLRAHEPSKRRIWFGDVEEIERRRPFRQRGGECWQIGVDLEQVDEHSKPEASESPPSASARGPVVLAMASRSTVECGRGPAARSDHELAIRRSRRTPEGRWR